MKEDNNNFFWDDTNNRLGIGTKVPQYVLSVSGTIDIGNSGALRIGGVQVSDYFITSAGTVGQVWMSDGTGAGAWTNTSSLGMFGYGNIIPLANGGTGAALTAPTVTSTLKFGENGGAYIAANGTTTIFDFQYDNATNTTKIQIRVQATSTLTELSSVVQSSALSGITYKIWYSKDVSGNTASTTIGTYNTYATTTPTLTPISATIPFGNYLIIQATSVSSTNINSWNVGLGGFYPVN
jgi:hypothetical protein